MDSHDLDSRQLDQLATKARQMTAYLSALKQRMERRGFPVDDALFLRAQEAFDKVQHLWTTLHYLSCDKTRRQ
jgi:hypothetical protein